jgi:ABC transporter substrate binding protein
MQTQAGDRVSNRREFITLLGGAAAMPVAARAQQTDRVQRIGVLMGFPESDSQAQRYIAAFRDGLHKLGWTEGRNVRIDTRWATPAEANLMRQFAKELVALQPDLILSHTTPITTALLQQTRTISIVFATVADPVGSGFVGELPATGRQHHRFCRKRRRARGQVAGTAQGDCTACCQGRDSVQPCSGHMPNFGLIPSKPPLPPSQWRRSQPLFATCPSSNLSLPHRHASRMVALS